LSSRDKKINSHHIVAGMVYHAKLNREFSSRLADSSLPIVTYVTTRRWKFERNNGLGYGRHLGLALADNSSVTSVNVAVRGLLGTQEPDTSDELQPFLLYLATSQSLHCVTLEEGGDGRDGVTSRVLTAIAQNPSVHALFVFGSIIVQPVAFASFLDTARFLWQVEMNVWSFTYRHVDREVLGASFGRNQALRKLWLKDGDGEEGDNGIGELILSHLGSSVNGLSYLGLHLGAHAQITQFQALASVLCSTRTLSHLSLHRYTFNVNSMAVIVTALKSNRTLTCLTLNYCEMEQNSCDLWTRFLQSGDSSIRELQLAPITVYGVRLEDEESNALDSDIIGIALLAMVLRSSVQDLRLRKDISGGVPCYAPLFVGLTDNEAMVRLRGLKIECLDLTIAAALSQFLAKSSYLQELAMESLIEPEYARLLLSGIRRNGSVRTFTWNAPFYSAGEMALDPEWLKQVASYCERNKKIPILLAKSQDFTDDTNAADMDTTSSITPRLVPSLFLVAQQAPRVTCNNTLIGLLGVLGGDVIGPPQIVLAMKRSSDSMNTPFETL
jgi:hypothetical protein